MCFTFELNKYCVTLCLAVPHGPTLCLLCTLYTAPIYEDILHGNSNNSEGGQSVTCTRGMLFALVTSTKQPGFLLQPLPSPIIDLQPNNKQHSVVFAFVFWWDSTICLWVQRSPTLLSKRASCQLMAWRPPRHISDTRHHTISHINLTMAIPILDYHFWQGSLIKSDSDGFEYVVN